MWGNIQSAVTFFNRTGRIFSRFLLYFDNYFILNPSFLITTSKGGKLQLNN